MNDCTNFCTSVPKLLIRLTPSLPVTKEHISSVQFSRSVVSDSLWPHESQHARPPCPSPTPGVHPDSRPSSQWSHLAISSSVVPFSSCSQSLPASESFPHSFLLLKISHLSIHYSWILQYLWSSIKYFLFLTSLVF